MEVCVFMVTIEYHNLNIVIIISLYKVKVNQASQSGFLFTTTARLENFWNLLEDIQTHIIINIQYIAT